jgi:hypothetical protein
LAANLTSLVDGLLERRVLEQPRILTHFSTKEPLMATNRFASVPTTNSQTLPKAAANPAYNAPQLVVVGTATDLIQGYSGHYRDGDYGRKTDER